MADETTHLCNNPTDGENEINIRRGLDVIQSMIDISADRLEGLRTQCATSAELTQQEIRTLETKLVKMFSELLLIQAKLPERFPKGLPATGAELRQWLRVVGLSSESLNVVMQHVSTLEVLLDKNDIELRTILGNNANVREEEIRRLIRAMLNLKRCRHSIRIGEKEPIDLYWDSWDRHHHIHHRASGASPRLHRSIGSKFNHNQQSLHQRVNPIAGSGSTYGGNDEIMINSPVEISPPENELTHQMAAVATTTTVLIKRRNTISPEDINLSSFTPSPSPPNSPLSTTALLNKQNRSGKSFPTTPPPKKKHQTFLAQQQQSSTTPLVTQQNPLISGSVIGGSSIVVAATTIPSISGSGAQLAGSASSAAAPLTLLADPNPLIKSKSHESQLLGSSCTIQTDAVSGGGSVNATGTTTTILAATTTTSNNSNNNHITIVSITQNHQPSIALPTPRTRLYTEPSPDNYNDIVDNSINNLAVPRSPCTPIVTRGMGHQIAHRFTKKFKVMSTCDLCNKQMFFGLKCKECKYRCHKDCESSVPPSCGLPPEFVDEFKKSLQSDVFLPANSNSPNMGRGAGGYLLTTSASRRDRHRSQAMFNSSVGAQYSTGHAAADSSSAGSSCNSSTPSSPALLTLPPQTPATSKHTQFKFPEVVTTTLAMQQQQQQQQLQQQQQIKLQLCESRIGSGAIGGIGMDSIQQKSEKSLIYRTISASRSSQQQQSDLTGTTISNDSEKTISLSGSTSASTDSDRTPVRVDSTEEHDDRDDRDDRDTSHWPRQNSVSLKEWDIPFDDIELLEKIGDGRFGTVHRAQWHGAVAVKLLKEDYLDSEAFKLEVATFKKTRHENVVLFMGACIKPQAIVTSLCKGNTLYTHIHTRKDKFNLNKTTMVAQQISQGMGYLHARGIVHKDLKTKNIFLENGKVIITDFGLFSATKLQYRERNGLGIPNGWLCYLAPEIIQVLSPYRPDKDSLPFSKASDVHAFGTVWYELLCGEFPFKSQPPEAVIFQVGRGMKQTLANLQAARDVKDILMMCWSFEPTNRPDFAKLLTLLERLPKKRLARSPSHPIQLSRSAESVF